MKTKTRKNTGRTVSVLLSKEEIQAADAIAKKLCSSRGSILRMGLVEMQRQFLGEE